MIAIYGLNSKFTEISLKNNTCWFMMCLSIYYIEGPVFKFLVQSSVLASIVHMMFQLLRLCALLVHPCFSFIILKKCWYFKLCEYLCYAFNLIVFWHQWTMLQYYASVFLLKLFINALVDNLLQEIWNISVVTLCAAPMVYIKKTSKQIYSSISVFLPENSSVGLLLLLLVGLLLLLLLLLCSYLQFYLVIWYFSNSLGMYLCIIILNYLETSRYPHSLLMWLSHDVFSLS